MIKSNRIISIVLLCLLICSRTTVASEENQPDTVNNQAAATTLNLIRALELYSDLSDKDVDIVAGIFCPRLSLQTKGIDECEQIELIESELRKNGIGLFEISTNRVVATWLKPVEDPARKFLNYCRNNKIAPDMAPVEVNSREPEILLAMKKERDDASAKFRAIRDQDEEYQLYMETSKGVANKSLEERKKLSCQRKEIRKRLLEENEAYRKAAQELEELDYLYRIHYLEHVINDIEDRGFSFPLLWMAEQWI